MFVFVQAAKDAGARLRPQRFRDGVGIEQVLHRLQPHLAADRFLAQISEQFLGVECEPAKIYSICKLPVRLAEAPAPRGKPLKRAVADQDRHGLAPAGDLHRLAVLGIVNERQKVSSRFGDGMSFGHMYTISAPMTTRYPGP